MAKRPFSLSCSVASLAAAFLCFSVQTAAGETVGTTWPSYSDFQTALSPEGDEEKTSYQVVRWEEPIKAYILFDEENELAAKAAKVLRYRLAEIGQDLEQAGGPGITVVGSDEIKEANLFIATGNRRSIVYNVFRVESLMPFDGVLQLMKRQANAKLPLCAAEIAHRPEGSIAAALISLEITFSYERCISEEITQTLGLRGEFIEERDSILSPLSEVVRPTAFDQNLLRLLYSTDFGTGQAPSKSEFEAVSRALR